MIQNIIVVLVLGRLRYELSGYRGLLGFLWGERFKNVLAQRPIVRFSESFEALGSAASLAKNSRSKATLHYSRPLARGSKRAECF